MDTLDLSDVEKEQTEGLTRWTAGPVSFKVRYNSPRQSTKFRRRLEHLGVMKGTEILKQAEYCSEWAKEYVLDWKGVTLNHEPLSYDASRMGALMFSHADVFNLLHAAVMESEAFFGVSGNGNSRS